MSGLYLGSCIAIALVVGVLVAGGSILFAVLFALVVGATVGFAERRRLHNTR